MNPRINRRNALLTAGIVTLLAAAVAFLFGPWFAVPALDRYGAGTVLTDRHGHPLRIGLGAEDQDCRPVSCAEISPWAVSALIAAEDKRFERHAGVDPIALLRALGQNIGHRRRISGASTISTQVVRLAEPRARTLTTKVVEAIKALRMEMGLTKAAILEQHMNRATFGGNLTGIEAAGRLYFDKSARDLTLAEAALLMGLPQSPSRLRPDLHPQAARKRMQYVLDRMKRCGFITASQRAAAERQPLDARARPRPFLAPHFCDFVLSRYRHEGALRTTLDSALQGEVERITAGHTSLPRRLGIHGAAVVVLEVETGAVRAMLGSPDYFSREHAGMVNGAIALKSPGSALKPFIYAMALEQGMLTPGALLDDSPLHFRDISPANFDGAYRGQVSVRNALIASLNSPALKVTEQVGIRQVLDGLRALGLNTLTKPPDHYGLGIALGGGEVRLLDLVNAYACLARGGIYQPFRVVENQRHTPPFRVVFSSETAWMISDILGGDERSLELYGHVADAHLPRIAWKTGTSSGFRDAWTVAWNPDYVVGVWLGNPSGPGTPGLTGAASAAPMAGAIFRSLCAADGGRWFERPPGVASRTLADGSSDWYVPGVSPVPHPAANAVPKLRIVTPPDGMTYRLLDDARIDQTIRLQAASSNGASPLHWFANGRHIGTSVQGLLCWPLREGVWTLVCCDPDGNQARIAIEVEPAEKNRPSKRSGRFGSADVEAAHALHGPFFGSGGASRVRGVSVQQLTLCC